MPTYDPTFRGSSSDISTGGTSSKAVTIPAGTVAGDRLIVSGWAGPGLQITPPDGTWTRLNGVINNYQVFTKIYSPGMNVTFSWGSNNYYVFHEYSFYSAGGGTISIEQLVSDFNGSAHQITSKAITPVDNALVLIDFMEVVTDFVNGPAGLTVVLGPNVQGSWGGDIYIAAGVASSTYTATSQAGGNWQWGVGTFSLISSIPNPLRPDRLTDEALFTPKATIRVDLSLLTDEAIFLPSVASTYLAHPPLLTDEALFTPSIALGLFAPLLSDEAIYEPGESGFIVFPPLLSDEAIFTPETSRGYPFCLLPNGVHGIPFELQTPAKLLDRGRLALCSRFFIRINTHREPLALTILVDKQEFPYPLPIQTAGLQTVPVAFQASGRIYSIRLTGCLSVGQVEFYAVWTDLDEGMEPQTQGQ